MGPAMKIRLRDGTGSRIYRFLTEDVDRHGNVRIYFRRKGQPKIRLTETPGTQAFDKEYLRAFQGELAPPQHSTRRGAAAPGTMRWLCEQYYTSAAFLGLGDSTQNV